MGGMTALEKHREAMSIVNRGTMERDWKIHPESQAQAYALEIQAANEWPHSNGFRQILYRSAAWMAYHAGMYAEARASAEKADPRWREGGVILYLLDRKARNP